MKRYLVTIGIGVIALALYVAILTVLSVISGTSFEYTAILFLLSVYVCDVVDRVWK